MQDSRRFARRAAVLRQHLVAPASIEADMEGILRSETSAALDAEAEKDVITYKVLDGGIGLVTLNRPTRLNSLTNEMQALYFDMLEKAAADERVRVIVVTGAGRAFCAGAEMELLKTIGKSDSTVASKPRRSLKQSQATRIPKPIIAAINGPAAGLGFVLAMHADIRFTTSKAKFTSAFAKRGLVAEHGSSYIMPRVAGVSNALDILLSSRVFLGDEAKELGIVSRVYPDADALMKATLEYAREMATWCSPASMAEMKRQVYEHLDQDQDSSYTVSDDLMKKSFQHPDSKEGVASYVEKREPTFQGLKAGFIRDQK